MNLEDELKEKVADIAQLQADLKRLVEEKILREEIASQQNKFKVENKRLHENYENKCLKIKYLKNELSVALKRSRQEHKEYSKAVTQENELLQKKNVDLHEFKTKKVNDERNERIRKKKRIEESKPEREKGFYR